MTRNLLFCLVALPIVAVASGCFEVKTVVTVEKDGSGTVEQRVYYEELEFGPMGLEFSMDGEPVEFNGQSVELPGEDAEFEEFEFSGEDAEFSDDDVVFDAEEFDFDANGFEFAGPAQELTEEERLAATRAQAEKTAAGMGEGVSVQTVEALPPKNGRQGVRIVYAFTDINQLRVDTLPEVDLGGGGRIGTQGAAMGVGDFPLADEFGDDFGAAPALPADDDGDTVRFEFISEPMPTLTIFTPDLSQPMDAGPPADDDPQAAAMAKMMMTHMLDGMLVEFHVRVNGRITDTNATYVSRNRNAVGLFRMDFGSVVKDAEALDKLIAMEQTTDPEEAKRQLQDPPLAQHLRMEMSERVEVAFE